MKKEIPVLKLFDPCPVLVNKKNERLLLLNRLIRIKIFKVV
jgi:hypothetical protein